jgi:hypothetical protein
VKLAFFYLLLKAKYFLKQNRKLDSTTKNTKNSNNYKTAINWSRFTTKSYQMVSRAFFKKNTDKNNSFSDKIRHERQNHKR